MTDPERQLLLLVANVVAEWEEQDAAKQDTTSHVTDEIRRLTDLVRQKRLA
ncbi:MAG: hypothetical protein ABSD80_12245 [Caulobacteraceae bacterium]|jgi:hypothetical protein